MDSKALIEGSSPKTSSPTRAVNIASSMAGVGRVTVSERRSMGIFFVCLGSQFKGKCPDPSPQNHSKKQKAGSSLEPAPQSLTGLQSREALRGSTSIQQACFLGQGLFLNVVTFFLGSLDEVHDAAANVFF